ncbi:cagY like domain protein [Helicobacter pylori]|uniref:cagY like domain protein n=1 Tax=Helicobacter pylori TaxID=210 RepID=UPI00031B1A3D|nr:cagY like domain protein [Helicobacter pylori]
MFFSHDKSFQGSLPHIATMGRDKILQQTPLKLHLIKRKNKIKKLNEKIKK